MSEPQQRRHVSFFHTAVHLQCNNVIQTGACNHRIKKNNNNQIKLFLHLQGSLEVPTVGSAAVCTACVSGMVSQTQTFTLRAEKSSVCFALFTYSGTAAEELFVSTFWGLYTNWKWSKPWITSESPQHSHDCSRRSRAFSYACVLGRRMCVWSPLKVQLTVFFYLCVFQIKNEYIAVSRLCQDPYNNSFD